VEGEVEVGALVVDEGGTLQGSCARKGSGTKERDGGKARPAEKPRETPAS